MRLLFLGGVRTVTGSMHVLETNHERILLECGLYQGRRQESYEKNSVLPFPFDLKSIDSVVLSHAHIDHSGNLPTLCKKGFEGNIFTTPATRDLCSVMLMDAAYIQKQDAEYINKHELYEEDLGPVKPIYEEEDVLSSMRQFVSVDYHRSFKMTPSVKAKFLDAGHVLGSSIIVLEAKENGKMIRVGFSGDLGRKNMPLIKNPETPEGLDYLIIESTYGDREHDPIDTMKKELTRIVNETYARKGKLLIPSFALERTQLIVFALHQLTREKKIPEIPIYVDSPLSISITDIFKLHPNCLNEETRQFIKKNGDPFGFKNLVYLTDVESSRALNYKNEAMIIISGSGMCEGGRIVHHLRNNIENPNNTILIVGYQAQHTLGRRIVERRRRVRIFGVERDLNARVEVINSFSAHADKNELLEFVEGCGKRLKGIFIVHGDEEQSIAFAQTIQSAGFSNVIVPTQKQFVELVGD
ncbi:MAG: MBL fold metallo-hydrolase [Deltaproteobacteria bacterium]|nr:MBL fold metallo-hydrolase [Deltaproteobacteria bacterium]